MNDMRPQSTDRMGIAEIQIGKKTFTIPELLNDPYSLIPALKKVESPLAQSIEAIHEEALRIKANQHFK